MKSSAVRPDQASRLANPSTSGRLPWDILVRVDAETPAPIETSRQVIDLDRRWASSATKNPAVSNVRFTALLISTLAIRFGIWNHLPDLDCRLATGLRTCKEIPVNEHAGPPGHDVIITVNEKPVTVTGPKATGLEIKQAAIAQGVQIGLDFQLSEELANGRTRIVGDAEPITVNKNSRFDAVAGDDNS
jgi:hypothetical protein